MNKFICPYCQFQCKTEVALTELQHVLCPRCNTKHVNVNSRLIPLLHELPRKNNFHRGACPFCNSHYEFEDNVSAVFSCPECKKEFYVEAVTPPQKVVFQWENAQIQSQINQSTESQQSVNPVFSRPFDQASVRQVESPQLPPSVQSPVTSLPPVPLSAPEPVQIKPQFVEEPQPAQIQETVIPQTPQEQTPLQSAVAGLFLFDKETTSSRQEISPLPAGVKIGISREVKGIDKLLAQIAAKLNK